MNLLSINTSEISDCVQGSFIKDEFLEPERNSLLDSQRDLANITKIFMENEKMLLFGEDSNKVTNPNKKLIFSP